MKQATQQRMTRQQVLDSIFKQVHGQRTRVVQLSVPGREITLAHVIGKPDPSVYTNLCLEIGFHADFDQEGRAIGILQLSPAESAVIAADVAVKAGEVDVGFMDRFSGALIITEMISISASARFHSNNTSLRKGSSCEKCICAAAARQAKPR